MIAGASCFEMGTGFDLKDSSEKRTWIWKFSYIDPEYRRKGIITRSLDQWRSRYDEIAVELPVSASMDRLLQKIYETEGWRPSSVSASDPNSFTTDYEDVKAKLSELMEFRYLVQPRSSKLQGILYQKPDGTKRQLFVLKNPPGLRWLSVSKR